MNDLEQNISELNIIWIKSLKKLHEIIKPLNIFFSLLKNTNIIQINSGIIYVFSTNITNKNNIEKYKKEIIKEFNENWTNEKITDLVIVSNKSIEKNKKSTSDEIKKNKFDWLYFDNNKAINQIENFISQDKIKLLLIKGPQNSGKSFLVEKMISYLRYLHKNVNNYNLSTIYYLLDQSSKVKNHFFILDNIEQLSQKKQNEVLKNIKNYNNFFILTTNKENQYFENILLEKKYKFITVKLNKINDNVIEHILKSKIKFTVYPSSYKLLTDYLKNSPKDIDKLLTSLNLFYRQNTNKIVNKQDIDEIVRMLEIKLSTTDVDKIFLIVSKKLSINIDDIKSHSRKRKLVISRSLVAYILRKIYGYSLENISKILNRNSHSTIINLIKLYENKLIDNWELKNIFNLFNNKE